MKAIGWKAWVETDADPFYEVHSSGLIDWALLPDRIQVVMLYLDENDKVEDKPNRRICSGTDRYWWYKGVDGDWSIYHGNEPVAQVLKKYPGAIIKEGKWTSDKVITTVTALAMAERDK